MVSNILEINNLTSGYDKRLPILQDLSLSIPENKFVCIFGQNGSGKSTLLKTIAGIIPLTKGEIIFKGNKINSSGSWDRVQSGMGILLQSERIFPDFDVYTNVEMAGYTMKDKKELKKRIEKVFSLTGIFDDRLSETASNLSGGEQQILSLLRILVLQPVLLLLDEPSTGLSPSMQTLIIEILTNLSEEQVTILMIEQNVDFARNIAESFYQLEYDTLKELK